MTPQQKTRNRWQQFTGAVRKRWSALTEDDVLRCAATPNA